MGIWELSGAHFSDLIKHLEKACIIFINVILFFLWKTYVFATQTERAE